MSERTPPTLYLIPATLAAGDPRLVLPTRAIAVAVGLDRFVAERAKRARAFLRAIGHPKPLQEITIDELNEHTPAERLPALLAPLRAGQSCGLLAEAGCPTIADPGAPLVLLAHQAGVRVQPLVGPSAILLALMGSGLEGQRFAFHGYLPARKADREEEIRRIELESRRHQSTQIFIETPYRNPQLFESLMERCGPETLLCIAVDLTGPAEEVATRPVADWRRRTPPAIARRPAVFLLYAPRSAQRRS